jgi:polar amino acid transport system substrate-binding protein
MFWRKQCGPRHALLGILLVAGTGAARAETLKVLTEEFPPYNYTENGRITGFSTAVVQAVLKEAQLQGDFQSLPWARAYETAQTSDSVLIYSIARNPQREKLFSGSGSSRQPSTTCFRCPSANCTWIGWSRPRPTRPPPSTRTRASSS